MDKPSIKKGLAALSRVDPDIAAAYQIYGAPPPRIRPAGFETFLSTLVSQQISTSAAAAILGRVKALLPSVDAPGMLGVDPQALREAGMSLRKIDYATSLATAIVNGQFDVDALAAMPDGDAIKSITALRGFGRWSAEIYLMFSLGRRDIFPADDLALLVALGNLKGLRGKPTPTQARQLVAHWSPWQSVGSLFLWHYYRGAPQ